MGYDAWDSTNQAAEKIEDQFLDLAWKGVLINGGILGAAGFQNGWDLVRVAAFTFLCLGNIFFAVVLHELRQGMGKYYKLRAELFEQECESHPELRAAVGTGGSPYPSGAGATSLLIIWMFAILSAGSAAIMLYGGTR